MMLHKPQIGSSHRMRQVRPLFFAIFSQQVTKKEKSVLEVMAAARLSPKLF